MHGSSCHIRRWALRVSRAPTLAVLLLACNQPPLVELPASPHPIIIIDIDTLRADRLGCYGHSRDTSPNIDRLAAESIFFEWAFSQAPNTPPSQTTILTGLYPSTHGMIGDEDRVPQEVTTLAEALSRQGFTTAGFHDGGYMSHTFGMDQGFDVYEGYSGKGLDIIGPKVIDWVRDHADENFLLLIHTYDVHAPYDPPSPYREMFLEGLDPPTPGFEPTPRRLEAVRLSNYTDTPIQLPENDLEYAKALYDGGIRWVDTWIGEFLEELASLGLDQRSTLVLISDHGEEFQEHGSVLHEKLYSTVTHIPMMIRLPGAGHVARIPEVVGAISLMPTLLELTGTGSPDSIQGPSLLPLISGEDSAGARIALGESPFFGERRAVTTNDFRLLHTRQNDQFELYRYRLDRFEQRDLSRDHGQQLLEMQRVLDQWQAMVDRSAFASSDAAADLDSEDLEQLRDLGYIQ